MIKTQSSLAAQIIFAAKEGDIELLGKTMDKNILLENARAPLIKNFQEVKKAAKKAGAFGCTISGAGPSIVAITSDKDKAYKIRNAMINIYKDIGCNWVISPINNLGARIIDSSIEDELQKQKAFHDFY